MSTISLNIRSICAEMPQMELGEATNASPWADVDHRLQKYVSYYYDEHVQSI